MPDPIPDLSGAITRITVVVPLREWTTAKWCRNGTWVVVGTLSLVAILYATWIGVLTRQWSVGIAALALIPWMLLFGFHHLELAQDIWRGWSAYTLGINSHGVLAIAGGQRPTAWRVFEEPTFCETEDAIIIQNSSFWMECRLPKSQVSPEQLELVRRAVRRKCRAQSAVSDSS